MTSIEERFDAPVFAPPAENDHQRTRASVSLVIPARNEAPNLPWLFSRIPDIVDEVILVDGRSTDGTIEVARRLRPDVVVVPDQARGKGAALRAGFAAATGDYVVMIDADGSMDPLEIHRFVAALDEEFDVVKGSRFLPGGGSSDITRVRRLGNGALREVVNGLYGVAYTDLCYGFFAFRRPCLADLDLVADGFEIESEIVVRAARSRMRVAEVASYESDRRYGVSNLRTVRDGVRILRTVVRRRFDPEPRSAAVVDLRTVEAR